MSRRKTSMARKTRKPPKRRVVRTSRAGGTKVRRKIGRKVLAAVVLALLLYFGFSKTGSWGGFLGFRSAETELQQGEQSGNDDEITAQPDTIVPDSSLRHETGAAEKKIGEMNTTEGGMALSGGKMAAENAGRWNPKALLNKLFVVDEVRMQGAFSIPEDTLWNLVGNMEGLPLLEVDLKSRAQRIMRHPRVARVVLRRLLPGKLIIEIKERREIAQVVVNGEPIGIDPDGVVLSPPRPGWPVDVPVITGFKGSLRYGERIEQWNLLRALEWARNAERVPRVGDWIAEIHLDDTGLAWVAGASRCIVRPGNHDIVAQIAALEAFLAQSGGVQEQGKVIDLGFPGFLILRDDNRG